MLAGRLQIRALETAPGTSAEAGAEATLEARRDQAGSGGMPQGARAAAGNEKVKVKVSSRGDRFDRTRQRERVKRWRIEPARAMRQSLSDQGDNGPLKEMPRQ